MITPGKRRAGSPVRHGCRIAAMAVVLGVTFFVSLVVRAQSQQPPEAPPRFNLPETNFGSPDGARDDLPRPAPGFAHARVASNPQAPGATPIGERTCIACHKLEVDHFTHTLHALGLHVANRSDPHIPVCEACHGPGSEHAADPRVKGLIIGYTHDSETPIETQTKTCLTCHSGGARDRWLGSAHQRQDLSCSDCHNPMAKFSAQGLMAKSSINDTCAQCHKDILEQFSRRSHMPLPEGHLSCADCHNPHGTLNDHLLKTATVNETCYQCHADKRGPFLFEHAPVRENCLNCHLPHGSNQSTLLVAPVPFICQQCHTNFLHPNDLQTRQALGTGIHPDERVLGRGCLTCHANIHGSNAASGVRFHE